MAGCWKMNWPLKIEDAFNIVRPLTPEERQQMHDIAVDLAKRSRPMLIIQDPERPLCVCGGVINGKGRCPDCGRDELGWT